MSSSNDRRDSSSSSKSLLLLRSLSTDSRTRGGGGSLSSSVALAEHFRRREEITPRTAIANLATTSTTLIPSSFLISPDRFTKKKVEGGKAPPLPPPEPAQVDEEDSLLVSDGSRDDKFFKSLRKSRGAPKEKPVFIDRNVEQNVEDSEEEGEHRSRRSKKTTNSTTNRSEISKELERNDQNQDEEEDAQSGFISLDSSLKSDDDGNPSFKLLRTRRRTFIRKVDANYFAEKTKETKTGPGKNSSGSSKDDESPFLKDVDYNKLLRKKTKSPKTLASVRAKAFEAFANVSLPPEDPEGPSRSPVQERSPSMTNTPQGASKKTSSIPSGQQSSNLSLSKKQEVTERRVSRKSTRLSRSPPKLATVGEESNTLHLEQLPSSSNVSKSMNKTTTTQGVTERRELRKSTRLSSSLAPQDDKSHDDKSNNVELEERNSSNPSRSSTVKSKQSSSKLLRNKSKNSGLEKEKFDNNTSVFSKSIINQGKQTLLKQQNEANKKGSNDSSGLAKFSFAKNVMNDDDTQEVHHEERRISKTLLQPPQSELLKDVQCQTPEVQESIQPLNKSVTKLQTRNSLSRRSSPRFQQSTTTEKDSVVRKAVPKSLSEMQIPEDSESDFTFQPNIESTRLGGGGRRSVMNSSSCSSAAASRPVTSTPRMMIAASEEVNSRKSTMMMNIYKSQMGNALIAEGGTQTTPNLEKNHDHDDSIKTVNTSCQVTPGLHGNNGEEIIQKEAPEKTFVVEKGDKRSFEKLQNPDDTENVEECQQGEGSNNDEDDDEEAVQVTEIENEKAGQEEAADKEKIDNSVSKEAENDVDGNAENEEDVDNNLTEDGENVDNEENNVEDEENNGNEENNIEETEAVVEDEEEEVVMAEEEQENDHHKSIGRKKLALVSPPLQGVRKRKVKTGRNNSKKRKVDNDDGLFSTEEVISTFEEFSQFKLSKSGKAEVLKASAKFMKEFLSDLKEVAWFDGGREKAYLPDVKSVMKSRGMIPENDPDNAWLYHRIREVAHWEARKKLIPLADGKVPDDIWDKIPDEDFSESKKRRRRGGKTRKRNA